MHRAAWPASVLSDQLLALPIKLVDPLADSGIVFPDACEVPQCRGT